MEQPLAAGSADSPAQPASYSHVCIMLVAMWVSDRGRTGQVGAQVTVKAAKPEAGRGGAGLGQTGPDWALQKFDPKTQTAQNKPVAVATQEQLRADEGVLTC